MYLMTIVPRATPTQRQVLPTRIFGIGGLSGDDDEEDNFLARPGINSGPGGLLTPAARPSLTGLPTIPNLLPLPSSNPIGNFTPLLGGNTPTQASSTSSSSSSVTTTTTSKSSTPASTSTPVLGVAAGVPSEPAAAAMTTIRGRPVPIATSIYETSSSGRIVTVTVMAPAISSGLVQTHKAISPTHKSFLQNKTLSSFVFTLCGLVAIGIITLISTCVIRRRRRKRLMNEAISFDPASMGSSFSSEHDEKGSVSRTDSLAKHASISEAGHSATRTNPGAAYSYAYGPGPTYKPRHPPVPVAQVEPLPYQGSPELAYVQELAYGGYYEPEHGDHMAYGGIDNGPQYVGNYHLGPTALNQAQGLPRAPPSLPAFNFISASPPTSDGYPDNPIHNRHRSIVSVPCSPDPKFAHAPGPTILEYGRHSPVTRSDSTGTSSGGHSTESYESATSTILAQANKTKHGRSHSRDLDPNLPRLPASPRLPDKFGMSEQERRGSVDERALRRNLTLKVANE